MKEDYLLPLIPYLAIVWKGRYRILLIVLLFGAIGVYRFFFGPKTYEAEATLLLAPPPFREGEDEEIAAMMAKTLKVEDYKRIVENPGVLQMAMTKVRGNADWPEEKIAKFAKPSRLANLMKANTEIIEKTPQNIVYSVVITLSAKADTPEAAAALADAWADASVEVVKESASGTTTASMLFLEGEYQTVSGELTLIEDQLDTTRDKYETELTVFNNETIDELNAIEDEMDLLVGEFDDKTKDLLQVHQNETDGMVQKLQNESETLLSGFENETEELLATYDKETEEMLRVLKDERELKLRELEAELSMELAQQRVSTIASEIIQSDRELMEVRKEMSDNQAEFEAATEELKQQPAFRVLSKAVTDDALWEKLSVESGALPEQLGTLKLRDEEANPVYDELTLRLSRARIEASTLPLEEACLLKQIEQKVQEYSASIKESKNKEFRLAQIKRELEVEWVNLERDRVSGAQQLGRERKTALANMKREEAVKLENLKRQRQTEYDVLQRQRESAAQALARTWLANLSQKETERQTEAMILQRKGELEAERLQRQVEQQKTSFEVLGKRYLSSQLATSDKTADIVIVGDVVPPDAPVGFARILVVPASVVVGLMVGLAFVFVTDTWRKIRGLIIRQAETAETVHAK